MNSFLSACLGEENKSLQKRFPIGDMENLSWLTGLMDIIPEVSCPPLVKDHARPARLPVFVYKTFYGMKTKKSWSHVKFMTIFFRALNFSSGFYANDGFPPGLRNFLPKTFTEKGILRTMRAQNMTRHSWKRPGGTHCSRASSVDWPSNM